MEMIELRHWIYTPPGCGSADINYNTNGNNGRVLLTRTSDRRGSLSNVRHEACMCGDRTPAHQPPFYYFVVQGPAGDDSRRTQLWWLESLRTAYSNLFDIWAQRPPCSGECLIMGGASDAWVTYGHSTARSVLFQLRAFAAFDPLALGSACGDRGVMLRFGGMTLDGSTVTCQGQSGWGETGAHCPTVTQLMPNFHDVVTAADDDAFLSQAGSLGSLTLETDAAVVTIDTTSGVQVRPREVHACNAAQPALNIPWRCSTTGGISDANRCLWTPAPAPRPSPAPVPPPAPKPGPAPAPVPAGYTLHEGYNCYRGQGGVPVDPTDRPVSSSASEDDCRATCDRTDGCRAFTRARVSSGDCFLRASVELGACLTGTGYDTYTAGAALYV